jgi:hypothetical protein
MQKVRAGVLVALMLSCSASARAAEIGVTAALVTDVPIDVAARLTIEGPERLMLRTSIGVMPGPYVSLINGITVATGAAEVTADLMEQGLEWSFVWRTHLGWIPFESEGFFIEAGYGFVTAGGGATSQQIIASATGQQPPSFGPFQPTFEVTSTLHMIDLVLGWRFALVERMVDFEIGAGAAFTVAASSTIIAKTPMGQEVMTPFTMGAAQYLDDTYRSYVVAPTVTLAIGYRLL